MIDAAAPEIAGHPLYTSMIRTALKHNLAICWPIATHPTDHELETACILHTLLNRGPLLLA